MIMENGGRKITKIRVFECGYCVNNMSLILKNEKSEKVKFPALVVLFEHSKLGNILYDTGYSKLIYKNGIVSRIYNLANKTYFEEKDLIINKLNGIKVDKIIISHAHPDHIGALKYFKDYELITSEEVFESIERHKLKDLVFKNMVPEIIEKKSILKEKSNYEFLNKYFDETYDILKDKSIIGVKLNGHSKGQIGLYVPEYKMFFVADSSWGTKFSENVENMKFIPKKIQNNFKKYKKTIEKINKFKNENNDIKIIYTHEKIGEKIYE